MRVCVHASRSCKNLEKPKTNERFYVWVDCAIFSGSLLPLWLMYFEVFKWNQTAITLFLLLSFSHFYLNSFPIAIVSVIVSFFVVAVVVRAVLIVHLYWIIIVRKRLRHMWCAQYCRYHFLQNSNGFLCDRERVRARNQAQCINKNFYSIISLHRLISLICEFSVARQHAAMKLSLYIVN